MVHSDEEKKAILLNALSGEIQNNIIDANWFGTELFVKVLDKLKSVYWTEQWKRYTQKLLHNITMEKDEDIISFIRKFNNIVANAKATTGVDRLFLSAIVETPYSEKLDVMISIKGKEWAKSVKNLQNECRNIKAKSQRRKTTTSTPSQVFYTPQKDKRREKATKLCTFCNNKGHTSDECRKKAAVGRTRNPKRAPTTTVRDTQPNKK